MALPLFNDTGSTESFPANEEASLTEANVRQHSVMVDIIEKCRRLHPDECCKYCAIYCNNLTNLRHTEIDYWRQDVNRNQMATPIMKTKPRELPTTPYTPPGRPDKSEGFRIVKTPKSLRKPKPSTGKKLRKEPKSQSSSTLDTESAEFQAKILKFLSDDGSYRSAQDSGENKKRRSPRLPTDTASRMASDSSTVSFGSGSMRARSSSNELLNVLTIDDCKAKHSYHKDAGRRLSARSSSNTTSSVHSPINSYRDGNRLKIPETPGKVFPNVRPVTSASKDTNRKAHFAENEDILSTGTAYSLFIEPNETAIRALDTMIQTRNVMCNSAKRGLFRYEQSCRPLQTDYYQSRRFHSLNNRLHELIEDQYLSGGRLQDKIRKFHDKHNPKPKPVQTPEPPKSAMFPGSARAAQRKHGVTFASVTQSPKRQNSHGQDSFLEILINMDDKKTPGTSEKTND